MVQRRIDRILDAINRHERDNHLTATEASTLLGTLNWTYTVLWGRAGAASLSPRRGRQRTGRFTLLNSALPAISER